MIGIVPTPIIQPRRASVVVASFPRRRSAHIAARIRTISRQKYESTAASVPTCNTAVNAAPGSSQPSIAGTIFKCAVLLIGINSVSPCTIASTII